MRRAVPVHERLGLTEEEWLAVLRIMNQPYDLKLYDRPQLPEPDFTLDEIDTAEQVMRDIG